MEKARRSPNGDFKEAYVAVTYDKKDSFKYYWMIADPNTIWQGVNKESIASIIVVNHKNVPCNVFRSWDISVNRDGSAYAWLIENTTSEGYSYYQLYMGGGGWAGNGNDVSDEQF